jgi:hypothetical protein
MLRRFPRHVAAAALGLSLVFGSTPINAAPGVPPASAWNCPKSHPIKGNINASRKTKIYHTPGSRYYSRTKPEVCFAKTADAVAAGYRAPKR